MTKFKEKVVYSINNLGMFGDPDCLEYIAETKELAEKYVEEMTREYPCFRYRIEKEYMIVGE